MKTPQLIADEESGEGSVTIPPEWSSYDAALRADLLGRWVDDLQVEHYRTLIRGFAVALKENDR